MKKIVGVFLLVMSCLFSTAPAEAKPASPLVVLVEQDPWLQIVGSDTPSFVLYDDGFLIYLDREHREYRSTRLTAAQLQEFIGSIDMKGFMGLTKDYMEWTITDLPTSIIYINNNGTVKLVFVYGELRKDSSRRGAERATVPQAFLAVFDKLTSYRDTTATSWLPDKLEVMVCPNFPEHVKFGTLDWPKNWPKTNDPTSRERPSGVISVYLDFAKLDEVKAFEKRLQGKGGVLINGKLYYIAHRYAFPSEADWMGRITERIQSWMTPPQK